MTLQKTWYIIHGNGFQNMFILLCRRKYYVKKAKE